MTKILIIDDEALIRKMLRKVLEKNGYEVMEACNGNEGIKFFKEHLPDMVITDLLMPEKEGLETIKEIKRISPDIKIIAISGGGMVNPDIYLNLARKFGAHHSFVKPVDNDELILTVKQLLAK